MTGPLRATLTLGNSATASWGDTPTQAATTIVSGHVFTAHATKSPARLLGVADVIHSTAPGNWLAYYPGCTLVLIETGVRLQADIRGSQPLQLNTTTDPVVFGTFLYAWLLAGCEPRLLCTRPVRGRTAGAGQWDGPNPFRLVIAVR